jgi:hypothetical protein
LPTFLPAAFAPACIFSPVSYTPSLISDIAGNAVASLKQVVEHIAVYSSLPRNNALCFIDAIKMPIVHYEQYRATLGPTFLPKTFRNIKLQNHATFTPIFWVLVADCIMHLSTFNTLCS